MRSLHDVHDDDYDYHYDYDYEEDGYDDQYDDDDDDDWQVKGVGEAVAATLLTHSWHDVRGGPQWQHPWWWW